MGNGVIFYEDIKGQFNGYRIVFVMRSVKTPLPTSLVNELGLPMMNAPSTSTEVILVQRIEVSLVNSPFIN